MKITPFTVLAVSALTIILAGCFAKAPRSSRRAKAEPGQPTVASGHDPIINKANAYPDVLEGYGAIVADAEKLAFLRDALNEFKTDEVFHFFKWGTGGPFNGWLNAVSKGASSSESVWLKAAFGQLLVLANEYHDTMGRETANTREFTSFIDEYVGLAKR